MNYTAQNILIKSGDTGQTGIFARVDAQAAGWDYLNMAAIRLNAGERYSTSTGDHEHVSVILGGQCSFRTSRGEFLTIGRRPNVFSGMPWAVYLPRRTDFEIEALTDGLEIASCWVPTDRDYPARLVTPHESAIEIRGGGNATRQINGIVPPGFDCHRIVAVEVFTPPGNWSSYPPHKHDIHTSAPDGTLIEADLEEIYFYKSDRPEGFAYQRVYTDDRRIDALVIAQHHDTVLVPAGYHPVVGAPGYWTYYLNFLAGSAQSLANSDDPAYAWVKSTWTTTDPRVPIVNHALER